MNKISVYAFLLLTFLVLITEARANEHFNQAKKAPVFKPVSISYWLWPSGTNYGGHDGSQLDTDQNFIPESLYVKAGEVTAQEFQGKKEPDISLVWPVYLPAARSYNAVVRISEGVSLSDDLAVKLAGDYRKLQMEASRKGQKLELLQIDYDSPSEKLSIYASFLKKLASLLENGTKLSITALLDWFRTGTEISSVIANVYEFVPQFYDVNPHPKEIDLLKYNEGVAHLVDLERWRDVFNSFGKPYRIGIPSFGRVYRYEIDKKKPITSEKIKIDSVSVDGNPEYSFQNPEKHQIIANLKSVVAERILRFENKDDCDCCTEKGIMEIIIPTRESFLSEYRSAAAFDGGFRGIVIFRWPLQNEKLIITPDEIESYINAAPGRPEYGLKIEDGYCVAVKCSEIYVGLKDFFPEKASTIVVRSSSPLEYFIPGTGLKSKVTGEKNIQITVPPYSLKTWIYLGRAVNRKQADFSIQEQER